MTRVNRRLYRAAMAALDAMVTVDHASTDQALDHLTARYGPAGLTEALVVWCDAALGVIPGDGPVELRWKNYSTGRVHATAGSAPPAEQWAGRLLAARAAGDLGMFTALAQAVPAERVPEHVSAMVQMAARIILEAA